MKNKKQMPGHDAGILANYRRLRILVVGDVMIDHYIQTEVERTSPEAPVPVAAVRSEFHVPGGAANVAANCAAMGARVILSGITGRDENGAIIRRLLEEKGIGTTLLISDSERPTTQKTRILSRGQQILRIDREEKKPPPVKLQERLLKALKRKLENIDGVIISDYAKGVCSPYFIQSLLKMMKPLKIPVVCDPKGLDFAKYRGIHILTPNFKETQEASGITLDSSESLKKAARKILSLAKAEGLVITKGKQGVSLFCKGKPPIHIPAHAREVYDVTGAGDTFISHFALAYFSGAGLRQATEMGNFASALVIAKLGVAVVYPEELTSFIRSETYSAKMKTLEELKEILRRLKSEGGKVVFTNGCFDLIHIGHIKFLQEARKLGDCLIVGINTDASVRRVKGEGRPLISEMERADLLASLHWVDYVILFDETTPEPLLRALKPDILVKGKNLRMKDVVGHEIVNRYGGEVRRLPFFSNISTKEIIHHIFESLKKQVPE
ncbi:D-glycero-beta-D-manno-heptose-7-phosphate kinase [Candidatus Sumerlaeota bacterium]|nr:D-glycero-beta-D-manno-heptose-7-phosphate kinase [Candidatus Sumerlaeota bacterium]